MSTIPQLPMTLPPARNVYRFTVEQYDRMVQDGTIREDDPVELLNGIVVRKMPRGPRHVTSTKACQRTLHHLLAAGWHVAKEDPVRIPDHDEPEPDIAVVRGADTAYRDHHPGPGDIPLVVEVADSSLTWDRTEKLSIYAHAGISVYWIINLIDGQVEVYNDPNQVVGRYATQIDYKAGQDVPVIIDGQVVGQIAVADLIP